MSLHSPPGFAQVEDGRHGDRPGPRAGRTRLVLIALLVFGLIGAAARAILGPDDEDTGQSSAQATRTTAVPTPTAPVATDPPPSATSAVSSTENIVRARYFEFWRAFDSFGARTAPFDPVEFKRVIGAVASGGEYTHLFDYFQANRLKGLAFRGGGAPEEELSPEIRLTSATEAVVTDCAGSSGEVYKIETGETVEAADPTRERLVVVMRLEGDVWKVTSVGGPREPCAS